MKRVVNLFDYMYYRVAKTYSKLDTSQGSTGIWAVICCQMFIVIDVFCFLVYLFFNLPERIIVFQYSKIGLVILVIILFRYNYKKYNSAFWTLHLKWKDEIKRKKNIKGIIVILAILIPILVPVLILL